MADQHRIQPVYDNRLEGLRGLCALVVTLSHLLTFNFFQSSTIPCYNFLTHLQFAHESVLIFFVLSGYVIGLNHIHTPFNTINIIAYLKKRVIRLYPIYLLAIIISFGFYFGHAFSMKELIGHLFFTQEFLVSTISSNSPLWSLSYEVVFYILFLGLWKAGKYNIQVCITIGVLSIAFILRNPDNTILKSVLVGAIFWMTGLYIAQTQTIILATVKRKWCSFLSYFAIVLSIHSFDTRDLVQQIVHLKPDFIFKITFGDVLYLPICFVIIMEITNRYFKYMTLVKLFAYAIPAFHLFVLIYFRHHLFARPDWIYGACYFVLAVVALPVNLKINFFGRLSKLGHISYALYVFHFPVLYFLNSWFMKYFSGIALFIIGLSASILIIGTLSIVAELFIQPRVKKYLLGKS